MRSFLISFLVLSEVSLILSSVQPIQPKCWFWDSPCLIAYAQGALPAFAAGIPKLDTNKLDTMFIDFVHIDQEGLKADVRNLHVQGLKDAVIEDISVDMASRLARLVFNADVTLRGKYATTGVLLTLPIYGDGNFTMNFKNMQIEMIIPFEIIQDAYDNDIMELKSFQYNYDVRGGATFEIGNIYNGDTYLSDILHDTIHKNWKMLTIQYGRYYFDSINQKIFNSIRTMVRSEPLGNSILY